MSFMACHCTEAVGSYSFSCNLGKVALQLVLVFKGPSIYFTIYFIILLKTKLKHIMNNIYLNI